MQNFCFCALSKVCADSFPHSASNELEWSAQRHLGINGTPKEKNRSCTVSVFFCTLNILYAGVIKHILKFDLINQITKIENTYLQVCKGSKTSFTLTSPCTILQATISHLLSKQEISRVFQSVLYGSHLHTDYCLCTFSTYATQFLRFWITLLISDCTFYVY